MNKKKTGLIFKRVGAINRANSCQSITHSGVLKWLTVLAVDTTTRLIKNLIRFNIDTPECK